MSTRLILASSSPFRRELLARLNLEFDCIAPEIDESHLPGESAHSYVCRLAEAKAEAITKIDPEAIVIGSDQCALLNNQILGKPITHERAIAQLKQAQGNTVEFHTGLCVAQQSSGFCSIDDICYAVDFRELNDRQIAQYVAVEKPYHCAGSFKSEGYGITLIKSMRGEDPTALIGLPLIRLVSMLEAAGVKVV